MEADQFEFVSNYIQLCAGSHFKSTGCASLLLQSVNQYYNKVSQIFELQNSSEKGSPYPNIIGFIDGTCRSICRPKYNQQQMYSGYKKKHVSKYQSVVLTNGLIGRLDGPFIGRRHDAAIVHLSGILDEMRTFLTNNDGTHWAVYGDAGYSNQKFIKVGFKKFTTLNRKQNDFNRLMSSLRVGVEYGFGKIVQQFAFLDFQKSQKQYLSPLKEMFYVAAFLTNCQACIRGRNQVSDIFKSYVPTLEEYLA